VSTNNTTQIRALQDFTLSQPEFDRLRELVREHTGIALSDAKRQLVYGRLARRLRALKMDSFGEYIDMIEDGDPAELEEFINAVTTNLTSFFREAPGTLGFVSPAAVFSFSCRVMNPS